MALDFLFAIRGLLSFVAFTELTNAGRCLLPIPYYTDNNINSDLSSSSTYIQVQLIRISSLHFFSYNINDQHNSQNINNLSFLHFRQDCLMK